MLLVAACADETPPSPEPVVLHRLNRFEYDRTVRDLLGTAQTPARAFPPDAPSLGFDNVSDVLSLSPLALELHYEAAQHLVAEVIGEVASARWEAESLAGPDGAAYHGATWRLTQGRLDVPFEPVATGTHRLAFAAFGEALEGPAMLEVSVDGDVRSTVTLADGPARHEVSFVVSSTTSHTQIALRFVAPRRSGRRERAAYVDWVRIDGPLDGVARGPGYDRVFTCDEATNACFEQIFTSFLRRAYRRTPSAAEVRRWTTLARASYDAGDRFDVAVGRALSGVLVSPKFLYRVEPSGDGPLDDFSLASRLSYFLWSSAPDDRLLDLAEAGRLREVLPQEVDRMLADERAEALVDGFAAQWLSMRAFEDSDSSLDDALRAAMAEEMRQFAAEMLTADRPVEDLLLADFTYVDANLAAHYGLAHENPETTRVTLPADSPRRGLLGKGALLVATSHPNRSSPVKRGIWVLDHLLCLPPPPPPPDVPQLVEAMGTTTGARARLEQHRSDPACAACHASIDPIGFALEPFDEHGVWRDTDVDGVPIDASGVLPDGTSFDGPVELSRALADRAELRRCVAKKVFVYALGRGPTDDEAVVLDDITARYGAAGGRMRDLLKVIATSEVFASARRADR